MIQTEFSFQQITIKIFGYTEEDWIFSTIDKYKTFYEIDLLNYIKLALGKQKGCMIDVGANIGNHSVYFGKVLSKEVIAFEPNPELSDILTKNLINNDVKFEFYKLGLGDKKETFSIDSKHKNANHNIGAAKLTKDKNGQIEVECLDNIQLKKEFLYNGIAAIKVDIEGMEPQMLRGSIVTITKYKPDLFLEINENDMMKEIESILYPLGYMKLYSYAGTPVWHFSHLTRLSYTRRSILFTYYSYTKLRFSAATCWRFIKSKQNS